MEGNSIKNRRIVLGLFLFLIWLIPLSNAEPWNLSISVPNPKNFTTSTSVDIDFGFYISPDGKRIFIVDIDNLDITQFNMTSAWHTSTSFFVDDFSVAVENGEPYNVAFNDNGTQMFVSGLFPDYHINTYNLTSAWDLTTAIISYQTLDLSPYVTTWFNFGMNGSRVFIHSSSSGVMRMFDLSTPWNLNTSTLLSSEYNFPYNSGRHYGSFYI